MIVAHVVSIVTSSVSYCYFLFSFPLVTEYEIQRGLLCSAEASKDSLCFMREITNLEKNLRQRRAQKYIDVITSSTPSSTGGNEVVVDTEAQQLLELLRKDKILKTMDRQNVVFLRPVWKDIENRSPSDDPEYLERFCNSFCNKVGSLHNWKSDYEYDERV